MQNHPIKINLVIQYNFGKTSHGVWWCKEISSTLRLYKNILAHTKLKLKNMLTFMCSDWPPDTFWPVKCTHSNLSLQCRNTYYYKELLSLQHIWPFKLPNVFFFPSTASSVKDILCYKSQVSIYKLKVTKSHYSGGRILGRRGMADSLLSFIIISLSFS